MSSALYQPHVIPFYFKGFAGRQIATVPSKERRTQLLDYFTKEIGGVKDEEWILFENQDSFVKAITKTRDVNGIVYDLAVKTGV